MELKSHFVFFSLNIMFFHVLVGTPGLLPLTLHRIPYNTSTFMHLFPELTMDSNSSIPQKVLWWTSFCMGAWATEQEMIWKVYSGVALLIGTCIAHLFVCFCVAFWTGYTNWHFRQQHTKVLVSLYPPQHFVSWTFIILIFWCLHHAIRYFQFPFSLIISEVEYLFTDFLAIWAFFLGWFVHCLVTFIPSDFSLSLFICRKPLCILDSNPILLFNSPIIFVFSVYWICCCCTEIFNFNIAVCQLFHFWVWAFRDFVKKSFSFLGHKKILQFFFLLT